MSRSGKPDRRTFLAGLAATAWSSVNLGAQSTTGPTSRRYRLGFTPFRPDTKADAWNRAFQTIAKHGDLTGIFLQDGIPWEAALRSASVRDYPASIRAFLEFQRDMMVALTPSHSRYIAFNPIATDYQELTWDWSDAPNQPKTYPWNTYDFDHPDVQQACLNFCRALVELYTPEYLNIGVESNILLARNYAHWPAYKELHRFLYTRLKAEFPKLQVFISVMQEHLNGLHLDSRNFQAQMKDTRPDILTAEIRELLPFCDVLAVSSYPYMISNLKLGWDYFDSALSLAAERKIPVGFDQTGYTSQPLNIRGVYLPGSEQAQAEYLYMLLQLASAHNFSFVVNFVPTDYGTEFGTDDVALTWAYSGLYRQNGTPKPALSLWDTFRALPYRAQ